MLRTLCTLKVHVCVTRRRNAAEHVQLASKPPGHRRDQSRESSSRVAGSESAVGEEPWARNPMTRPRRFCDILVSDQSLPDVLAVSAAGPRCPRLVPRLHLVV